MAKGGGRRRLTSGVLILEAVDAMLEVDKFLLWPLLLLPPLESVEALARWFGGRTRSVLICL